MRWPRAAVSALGIGCFCAGETSGKTFLWAQTGEKLTHSLVFLKAAMALSA